MEKLRAMIESELQSSSYYTQDATPLMKEMMVIVAERFYTKGIRDGVSDGFDAGFDSAKKMGEEAFKATMDQLPEILERNSNVHPIFQPLLNGLSA